MQYENVFKNDRWCSCYTCLPQTTPAAQTAQKMDAPGTGTGAPPVAQRLLTNTWPKTKLELFYVLQRSRGHKECLKRS